MLTDCRAIYFKLQYKAINQQNTRRTITPEHNRQNNNVPTKHLVYLRIAPLYVAARRNLHDTQGGSNTFCVSVKVA